MCWMRAGGGKSVRIGERDLEREREGRTQVLREESARRKKRRKTNLYRDSSYWPDEMRGESLRPTCETLHGVRL